MISSKDLGRIEPELSILEEILRLADSKCDEETVDSDWIILKKYIGIYYRVAI